MGSRMGSVSVLKQKGIDSIPTEEGVKRFTRLFVKDPGVHQVIIAARLSGLDTWQWQTQTPSQKTAASKHLRLDDCWNPV